MFDETPGEEDLPKFATRVKSVGTHVGVDLLLACKFDSRRYGAVQLGRHGDNANLTFGYARHLRSLLKKRKDTEGENVVREVVDFVMRRKAVVGKPKVPNADSGVQHQHIESGLFVQNLFSDVHNRLEVSKVASHPMNGAARASLAHLLVDAVDRLSRMLLRRADDDDPALRQCKRSGNGAPDARAPAKHDGGASTEVRDLFL